MCLHKQREGLKHNPCCLLGQDTSHLPIHFVQLHSQHTWELLGTTIRIKPWDATARFLGIRAKTSGEACITIWLQNRLIQFYAVTVLGCFLKVPIAVGFKGNMTIIDNTTCLKRQSAQPPSFIECLCGNSPSASLLAFTSSPPVVSWSWQSALTGRTLHQHGG